MSHFKIKALFVWEEDPDESHLGMEEQDTSNSTNLQTILKELRDFCHENSTEPCEIKGKIVKMSKGMDHTEKRITEAEERMLTPMLAGWKPG